jgi:PRA1 family protein
MSGVSLQFRPSATPDIRATLSNSTQRSLLVLRLLFLSLTSPSLSSCVVRFSLGEFLDLSSFKLPAQDDLVDRMTVNLSYYALNYFLIYSLLLLGLSTQHPSFLFATVALSAAGYYLFRMRTDSIVIGGLLLTEDQIKLSFAVISALLFFYVAGWAMVYVTALAVLIAMVHAGLRQRSIRSRTSVSLVSARDSVKKEFNDLKRDINRR